MDISAFPSTNLGSAITMSAIFYLLLKHSRCYAKLQKEVDGLSITPTKDGSASIVPYSTAQSMPYLNACLNEAMRMHVVTRMPHDRLVPATGLEIAGHMVPPGTDVGVYGPVLHHRRQIFGEDVHTFRPERWQGEKEAVRQMKNTLFTFSNGKYNCLGKNIARMEMTKFVPSVMRAYEV